MRSLVLFLLVVVIGASANLVGLNYADNVANSIVSVNPSSASISQTLPFNSQWLYAVSSTIDISTGTYYLFTMNVSGAFMNVVSLSSFSLTGVVPLSAPQIYCAQYDPATKSIFALSQNDSLIVQLVQMSPTTGSVNILYSFPVGWMVPYFTSAFLSSLYVVVLNSPTGQVMISFNTSAKSMSSFALGAAGIVTLATDGTPGSVLALRVQSGAASLVRQSLISTSSTPVATLPSSVLTFQYASAVASGQFYLTVRPPTSLTPLLLSISLSNGAATTKPLPSNTYLAFMKSTTN